MTQFEQAVCEAQLVQNLKHGWVNRVSTKLAVEVFVRFQKHHRNIFAREEQREDCSAGAAADNTAGRDPGFDYLLLYIPVFGFRLLPGHKGVHLAPAGAEVFNVRITISGGTRKRTGMTLVPMPVVTNR